MPAPKRPQKPAARASAIRTLILLACAGVLLGIVAAAIVIVVASQSAEKPIAPGPADPSVDPADRTSPRIVDQSAGYPVNDTSAERQGTAGDDEDEAGYMPDFSAMDAMDEPEREPAWALTSPRGMTYLAAAGRSPIPNVGEEIAKPLPFVWLEKPAAQVSTDTPGDVVPWYEAELHVGQTITIEGTIVHASNTGSVCFLNFDPNWREHFYVIIFADAFPMLPDKPELFYMDKKIRVTGQVYRRGGRAQMRIEKENWAQISVVEEKK
jgi:hypothetical protein